MTINNGIDLFLALWAVVIVAVLINYHRKKRGGDGEDDNDY